MFLNLDRPGCRTPVMTGSRRVIAVVASFAGAVGAALLSVGFLQIFSDAFSQGFTWSGLNPDGGGPGFLLLLSACGCSLLTALPSFARRTPIEAIVEAALAATAAVLSLLLFSSLLLENPPPLAPVASGVFGAFFVPRVVLAVLSHTWSEAEPPAPNTRPSRRSKSSAPFEGALDANP